MDLPQRIAELLDLTRRRLGDAALRKVNTAVAIAVTAHEGQVRKLDGAPYVSHCISVAHNCLSWGLNDPKAVCAAILHDTLEDTDEYEDYEQEIAALDPEVLGMVRSLSKIRNLQTGAGDLPATYRRILRAASKDLRVLVIKTFDVYHNSKTLQVHNRAKAKNKASLALIYVGVARRLGMMALADDIIEQILPHLMPIQHQRAQRALEELQTRSDDSMERLAGHLRLVTGPGLAESTVVEPRRLADYFYLTEKPGTGRLLRVGWPVHRIRILVADDEAAWRVLGRMHGLFGPLPRHVRDYMNAPRVNGFRALTTRILWDGHPLNVQVVRHQDDAANRLGILACWGSSGPDTGRYMRLLATLGDSDLRMSEVHAHVLPDLLDVYSPKGDRLTFPVGAVVVDFAYLVHTELGEQCIGAKINGINRPPEHPLSDGDVVQVLTRKGSKPQRAWLDVVKTARARTLIKQAIKNSDTPVKGITRFPTGKFQINSLAGQDILWSTCCLAVPTNPVVGRLSEDGRWIVHRSDCEKIRQQPLDRGSWSIQPNNETLSVTFSIDHRSGALLSVLELLARHGVNGQTIQGKGRSADTYIICLDLGGKPPDVLGKLLLELDQAPAVQEILSYVWLPLPPAKGSTAAETPT